MEHDRRLSLIVGGFIVASLGAIALAIVLLSADSGIFTPKYQLFASFRNVQGLLPGAPVWLAGKEVGRVSRVRFAGNTEGGPLLVEMHIDQAVQERVREDSMARIGTIGLLGDSYVEIGVGSVDARPLGDGEAIQVVNPSSISDAIATGTEALDSIALLAQNLNDVVEKFSSSSGGSRAADAVGAVSDIVLQVQEGSGMLHSLIYDDYEGDGIESIEKSLATLEDILQEIKEGDGILNALIYESPTEQDVVMETMEAGARLNSILSKIDRGEGTIGLFLNDPTLYEDLKVLLGGAQRSTVVRSLIRMAVDNAED